jgi:hypothetical protein
MKLKFHSKHSYDGNDDIRGKELTLLMSKLDNTTITIWVK